MLNRRAIEQAVFDLGPARWILAVFFLCRGLYLLRAGATFRGLGDLCWVLRVSRVARAQAIARGHIAAAIATIHRTGRNHIVESYRADRASSDLAAIFSLSGGGGSADLFRDVIVLKKGTADEKGVILLKYVRTFDALNAMFDVGRLMDRYTFVLEPCWAGYWHPSLLMFIVPGQPVLVQCFTDADYQAVTEMGAPLVPLRLGPADWVDSDLFQPPAAPQKNYDLVMVANWGTHKRHKQLFRALDQVGNRDIRVLLIGFPWSDRTADDIRREAAQIRSPRIQIEIIEKLPPDQVASHVSQCKVFVFLSRKEGDNKALVEAMFVDLPSIVYDRTIGGAGSRVNPQTGVFSSDRDLARSIEHMLEHYREFTPRAWALGHTGSANATRVVDAAIRRSRVERGEAYVDSIVEKTNSPNLAYKEPHQRTRFHADYDFVLSSRRGVVPATTKEVA